MDRSIILSLYEKRIDDTKNRYDHWCVISTLKIILSVKNIFILWCEKKNYIIKFNVLGSKQIQKEFIFPKKKNPFFL
jgi:hypothetical protein